MAQGVYRSVCADTVTETFQSGVFSVDARESAAASTCGQWRAYVEEEGHKWWANERLLLFVFASSASLVEDI